MVLGNLGEPVLFGNRKFRYNTSGSWFKGNTHIHSTASDGGKTLEELDLMYFSAGYDFTFLTDHWNSSNFDRCKKSLKVKWFEGVEYDAFNDETNSLFHIVLLGKNCIVRPDMNVNEVIKEGREKDSIIILAHPHWCGNSTEDAVKYDFDGVEIYNNTCEWDNGKSNGLIHWDQMLLENPNALAFAVDDAHVREGIDPCWNGGWIVVNAEKCNYESIVSSIKNGNYYSSAGPQIREIKCEGSVVSIKTSPVRKIRLIGDSYNSEKVLSEKAELTECSFAVPEHWKYAYIEIEDSFAKKAWTNNLFIK